MFTFLFNLTPHQLDVLRTLASIAGGIGGLLSGVAVVYSRLARNWAKKAADQTSTTKWVNGELVPTSVAELASNVVHTTEEFRGELTHMASEQARQHGRRRLPTTDIPITGESTYE